MATISVGWQADSHLIEGVMRLGPTGVWDRSRTTKMSEFLMSCSALLCFKASSLKVPMAPWKDRRVSEPTALLEGPRSELQSTTKFPRDAIHQPNLCAVARFRLPCPPLYKFRGGPAIIIILFGLKNHFGSESKMEDK